MRLAVTYEDGNVFQHFGHTEQFKIYDIENGAIVSSEIVPTNGQGHGALSQFLYNHGVDAVICGGIGGGARDALMSARISLFSGVDGGADEAVNAFLMGMLSPGGLATCDHHHGAHGCGEHGCGEHEHEHDCGASHGCGGCHGN